jgi:hypothetical protein
METTGTELRELAHRASDGLDVVLAWNSADGGVTVVVTDARTGGAFVFSPDRRRALEAFYHPFAFAPRGAQGRKPRAATEASAERRTRT